MPALPPFTVSVYVVPPGRAPSGVRVAACVAPLYDTDAAITAFAASVNMNVDVVSVVEATGSLNTTIIVAVGLTPAVPFDGTTVVTLGAVRSAVVNDHAKSVTRGLPAVSLTPPLPPFTFAV